MNAVKLVECPRDAWQGLPETIPTEGKVRYLRRLIECGFRHIDAVSFVSPKYVPQMADSEQVIAELAAGGLAPGEVEIIGIVVNQEGLERALRAAAVTTVGYPHSLSEKFLASNARTSVEKSRALVGELVRACEQAGRELVVYISMAFGNPYREAWSAEAVAAEVAHLKESGVRAISLADTVGLARPDRIRSLLGAVLPAAGGVEIGVHLHGRPEEAAPKVLAAYAAGCRRFDSALTGLGGCPFAGDELVGNIPTEIVVRTLKRHGGWTGIAPTALVLALAATQELRCRYARL
ncbi:MAG TPA: hydroxymethylglutaryl-CoA lyase [Patescibacteria group bacterium]|nr:hydroxymethylglutaryl-CoA lyase [Patescibacteria group bacterium]